MDPDLLLTIGIIIGVLTLPAFVAAWRDGRAPRAGAILLVVAGVLIVLASQRKPGGYVLGEIPGVIVGTISRLLN